MITRRGLLAAALGAAVAPAFVRRESLGGLLGPRRDPPLLYNHYQDGGYLAPRHVLLGTDLAIEGSIATFSVWVCKPGGKWSQKSISGLPGEPLNLARGGSGLLVANIAHIAHVERGNIYGRKT